MQFISCSIYTRLVADPGNHCYHSCFCQCQNINMTHSDIAILESISFGGCILCTATGIAMFVFN